MDESTNAWSSRANRCRNYPHTVGIHTTLRRRGARAGTLDSVHWSPRLPETLAVAAAGAGLALLTVALAAAGRLLVGGVALMLLALAGHDLLLRPRLSADTTGVVVRGLGGRRQLPWPVLRVRVRTSRRLGIRSTALELDTAQGPDDEGVLVLLGRRDLGEDPAGVAAALRDLAPWAPLG